MRSTRFFAGLLACVVGIACAPAGFDSEQAQALLNERYPGGTIDVIGVRMEGLDEAIAKVSFGGSLEADVVFRRYDTGWIADATMVMGQEVPLGEADGLGAPLQALMGYAQQARQRSTMEKMRAIAQANATVYADTGRYAEALGELQAKGLIEVDDFDDGWGNAFRYSTGADIYTIVSMGSDGAAGPAPPAEWTDLPYDPDIVLTNGEFTQAPSGG